MIVMTSGSRTGLWLELCIEGFLLLGCFETALFLLAGRGDGPLGGLTGLAALTGLTALTAPTVPTALTVPTVLTGLS